MKKIIIIVDILYYIKLNIFDLKYNININFNNNTDVLQLKNKKQLSLHLFYNKIKYSEISAIIVYIGKINKMIKINFILFSIY